MRAIKCDLPFADKIEILPLSDLHIGDANCDYKLIMERIEYIKNNDNVYCILDGDLMDTAVVGSVGDIFAAPLNPQEQIQRCVNLFGDIKDKILAVLPGNHEHRIYKTTGIDTTELFCCQLGIRERYSPTSAVLFVRFGENQRHRPQLYTIYAVHGSGGGGRREGGKINRLVDLSNIVDTDIYVCGHTHLPAVLKTEFYRVSEQNSSIAPAEKLYVNTAAALTYGGYGDAQSFKPASRKTPTIHLNGKRKEMKATL
jgi:UDP-2,3-diacylglucosamine pyrophosphatase LpxH